MAFSSDVGSYGRFFQGYDQLVSFGRWTLDGLRTLDLDIGFFTGWVAIVGLWTVHTDIGR